MNKEIRLKDYWIGKAPRTKRAVTEYMKNPNKTMRDIQFDFDVTQQTIRNHVKKLVSLGIYPVRRNYPVSKACFKQKQKGVLKK